MAKTSSYKNKDTYIINPNNPIEYLPVKGVIVSVVKKNGRAIKGKKNQKIVFNTQFASSCVERMLRDYELLTPILGDGAKQIIIYKSKHGEPVMSLFAMKEIATHTHVWDNVDADALLNDANKVIEKRNKLIQQAKEQFHVKK